MERHIHLEDTPGYYKTSKGRKQSTYEWKNDNFRRPLIVSLNKFFDSIKTIFNLVNSREPLLK